MSTRCQIEFVVKCTWKDRSGKRYHQTDKRLVYRHSDGYPDGVIPDLVSFLRWNGGRNDAEYITANFIYWSKRQQEDWYINYVKDRVRREISGEVSFKSFTEDFPGLTPEKITWDSEFIAKDHISPTKLGYGVCAPNDFHCDIEYFYTVEITEKDFYTVEITEKENEPNRNIIIICHTVDNDPKDPVTRKSFTTWGSVQVSGDGKVMRIAGFNEEESRYTDGSLTIDRLKRELDELDNPPVPEQAPAPESWLAYVEVD